VASARSAAEYVPPAADTLVATASSIAAAFALEAAGRSPGDCSGAACAPGLETFAAGAVGAFCVGLAIMFGVSAVGGYADASSMVPTSSVAFVASGMPAEIAAPGLP
jgi:hypothetical protein